VASWYVIRKGKEHGPYGDRQLRSFATKGKLKPHYRLRRADGQETFSAADVHDVLAAATASPWIELVQKAVRRISPATVAAGMLATLGVVVAVVRLTDIESPAAMVVAPDADALFAHDFSRDDMSIPPGAEAETRDLPVGDEAEPDLRGLTETAAGYVLPSGVFKRHGSSTIWWDAEKTVEASVGGAWHGRRHGQTLCFSRAGHRIREEVWVYGVRHGVWRSWDESGHCRSVMRYFEGELEDRSETWHDNGRLQAATQWRGGLQHGLAQTWFENGAVESQMEYADGVPLDSP